MNVHLQDLISRYVQIINKIPSESSKVQKVNTPNVGIDTKEKIQQPKKKLSPKKKVRPQINDIEIEKMILEQVFKIKREQ